MSMRKTALPILAALFAAISVSAQTPIPARQVSVDTNAYEYLSGATNDKVQGALDWIDANWDPRPSAAAWTSPVLSALTNESPLLAQHALDALDALLLAVPAGGALMKGTNIVGASFLSNQWTVAAGGVSVVSTNWSFLDGAAADDVQSVLDLLDPLFTNFPAGAAIMPGTNIAGGALVSNQWTGLMPGTNIFGFTNDAATWYPPYTNIYLRPGTNQGLTVVSNVAYLDYVVGDAPGASPVDGTLLLDLKLGSAYILPADGLAASTFLAPAYGALADWVGVTTASGRTNGIVQRSATGFTLESNGTYYASCDFYYAYPGPVYPIGARLVYVTNGVSTVLQESVGNTGSKTFNLVSTSFVGGATGAVRVEFSTPDGGQLFYSSFKLGVVDPP